MNTDVSLPVLALVRDLMFSSKIVAECRASGVTAQIIRQPELLAAAPAGRLLFVDLAMPEAIDAASSWQRQTGGRAIGFVSHVDTLTIKQAREAGLTQVMTRGQFTQSLGQILAAGKAAAGDEASEE